MAKGFNLSFEYVLYEISYANMILYSSVLPSYGSGSKKQTEKEASINADDPKNQDKIKSLLFG